MASQVAPYERYAAVYARTGQDAFSLRAWRMVADLLRDLRWQGRDVLDLACGTGAAALAMQRDGYRAVAVDLSRTMLLAALTRPEARTLPLVCADMQALPFADRSFDLVTSFYDSVNYLTSPGSVSALMQEVGRVLRPGGAFAFDLNTLYTLREHWTGTAHAVVDDDLASVWVGTWHDDTQVSSLRATFLVRGEDGRYERFDETHDERGFGSAELAAALAAGQLRQAYAEDMATGQRPGATTRRVLYIVRKS